MHRLTSVLSVVASRPFPGEEEISGSFSKELLWQEVLA
jgi:hypothetical protein